METIKKESAPKLLYDCFWIANKKDKLSEAKECYVKNIKNVHESYREKIRELKNWIISCFLNIPECANLIRKIDDLFRDIK